MMNIRLAVHFPLLSWHQWHYAVVGDLWFTCVPIIIVAIHLSFSTVFVHSLSRYREVYLWRVYTFLLWSVHRIAIRTEFKVFLWSYQPSVLLLGSESEHLFSCSSSNYSDGSEPLYLRHGTAATTTSRRQWGHTSCCCWAQSMFNPPATRTQSSYCVWAHRIIWHLLAKVVHAGRGNRSTAK